MLGDPAAADSFHAARALSADRAVRLRLAVEEAIVRIKFAVAERPEGIAPAREFADSILKSAVAQTPDDAELLLRIAMITGQCRAASRLAGVAATPIPTIPMPPSLLSDAHAFAAMSAAGCTTPGLNGLVDQIERAIESVPKRSIAVGALVGAVAAMNYSRDTAVVRRLAAATSDYLLAAERDFLQGDSARARAALEQRRPIRDGAMPGVITPDVALTESRIWLMLGDTATAVRLLDKCLTGLRYAQPLAADNSLANILYVGAVGAAAELRALLATNDPPARRRWALTAAELWKTADPELQARAARMRALADRPR
jgi:hypothetical protein